MVNPMEKLERAFGVSLLGLVIAMVGLMIINDFRVAGNLFIVVAIALGITTIRLLVQDRDAIR